MARHTAWLLALAASGCIGTPGQIRAVHEGLRGMPAREVRACLGGPDEIQFVDGREIWYMARPVVPDEQPTASPLGTMVYDRLESPQKRVVRFLESPSTAEIPPGYCRLRAVFDPEGRLESYEADGINSRELNADARCLFLAGACVQPRVSGS